MHKCFSILLENTHKWVKQRNILYGNELLTYNNVKMMLAVQTYIRTLNDFSSAHLYDADGSFVDRPMYLY